MPSVIFLYRNHAVVRNSSTIQSLSLRLMSTGLSSTAWMWRTAYIISKRFAVQYQWWQDVLQQRFWLAGHPEMEEVYQLLAFARLAACHRFQGIGWFGQGRVEEDVGRSYYLSGFESNDDNAKVHISGIAPDEAPMTRPSDLSAYKSLSAFSSIVFRIGRILVWKCLQLRLPIRILKPVKRLLPLSVCLVVMMWSLHLLLLLQMRQIWPQRHRIYSVSPMQRYSSSRQSWHNAVLSLMMPSCSMKSCCCSYYAMGSWGSWRVFW